MDLLPSADQLDMMASVQQFLDQELPAARRHALVMPAQHRAANYGAARPMSASFRLDCRRTPAGRIARSSRRHWSFRSSDGGLAPVGFLASVLAARLAHVQGEVELRDELTAGRMRVALAVRFGRWRFRCVSTQTTAASFSAPAIP